LSGIAFFPRVRRPALCAALLILAGLAPAAAQEDSRWAGPFGGRFGANFTIASEYAQSGISNTQRQPAFQAGLDYRTPELSSAPPAWLYGSVWGSNVNFVGVGPGLELDFIGGGKLLVLERKLKFDLSYIRYTYPDSPASADLGYGEIALDVDYNLDWAEVSARVRFSPNNSGGSGNSWNKRLRLAVPLDFLKTLNDDISFKAYGTLGNFWLEKPLNYGIDRNDYWYWQLGVITSVWGLDVNLAYTATNIPPEGCLGTQDCAGRFLAAVTKTF
jgi:uncharacterized protein (TIGR02001 family)